MARSRGQVASFGAVSATFFALARSFVAINARPASIKYARLPGSRSMAVLASAKALRLVSADCVYAMQRKACAGAKLGCSEITLCRLAMIAECFHGRSRSCDREWTLCNSRQWRRWGWPGQIPLTNYRNPLSQNGSNPIHRAGVEPWCPVFPLHAGFQWLREGDWCAPDSPPE